MRTLDEALVALQGIHGMVERMAMELKAHKPAAVLAQQVKRAASPLQGQLKGQFSLIADHVSSLILVAGRGASEGVRLRILREHVGQIRAELEVAMHKVREEHSVEIVSPGS
ncbi:MAG TPA: hypothetical protein VHE78_01600 [Gemmatimonadaceae bacterium]|nr:hypothetical protein [Gemmatimonadaceae bacterium]